MATTSFRSRRSKISVTGGDSSPVLASSSPRDVSTLVDMFAHASAAVQRKRLSIRPGSPFVLEPTAHRVAEQALRQLQTKRSVSVLDLSSMDDSLSRARKVRGVLTEQSFDAGLAAECTVSTSTDSAEAWKVLDGREFTSWRSSENTAWVLLDFGQIDERYIEQINIRWWSVCHPDTLVMEVSADNTLFDKVQVIHDLAVDKTVKPARSTITNVVFKQAFRYLRFRMFRDKMSPCDPHFHRFKIGIVSLGIVGHSYTDRTSEVHYEEEKAGTPISECTPISDITPEPVQEKTAPVQPPEKAEGVKLLNRLHRSLFPPAALLMQAPLESGAWGRELAGQALMPEETKVSVVHFAGPDYITRTTSLQGSLIRLSYVYPMKDQWVRLKARSYPSRYASHSAANRFSEASEATKADIPLFSRPASSYAPKSSTRATTAVAGTRPQTAVYARPGSREVDGAMVWRKIKKTGEYVNIETGDVVGETPDVLFKASHDLPLPGGWHRAVDAGLGLAYYWRDGQEEATSWEFPVDEVDEVA